MLDEVTTKDDFLHIVEGAQRHGGPLAGDSVVLTVSRATVLRPSDFGPAGVTVTWERLLPMSFHDVCVERGAQLPPCLPFGSLLASGAVLEQLDEDSGAELLSWFEEYLDHGGYPLAVAAALGKADSQAAGLAVGPLADHKQLFLVR